MKNLFAIHEFPFDVQFAEDEDDVQFLGYPVRVPGVSWGNFHEIMPNVEYFRDPKSWNRFKGQHNHVPYVEPDDLSHTPWFEVTDSSGMRAARETQKARTTSRQKVAVAMMSSGKGVTSSESCPDCGEPLSIQGDIAECKNGHKWNDLK